MLSYSPTGSTPRSVGPDVPLQPLVRDPRFDSWRRAVVLIHRRFRVPSGFEAVPARLSGLLSMKWRKAVGLSHRRFRVPIA